MKDHATHAERQLKEKQTKTQNVHQKAQVRTVHLPTLFVLLVINRDIFLRNALVRVPQCGHLHSL